MAALVVLIKSDTKQLEKDISDVRYGGPMDNHITVAGELVDILYRHMYISQDSGHYLFDILADALKNHPDLVSSLTEELKDDK